MRLSRVLACTAFGLPLFLLAAGAPAKVLTLASKTDSSASVADAATGAQSAATLIPPSGKLLVAVGGVAGDGARDLVFVAANPDSGVAPGSSSSVLTLAYGAAAAPTGSLVAPSGQAITALVYDAPRERLVGVFSDPTGTLSPQIFTATAPAGAPFGTPATLPTTSGCCRFTAGVSAWRASTQDLFLVGRRNADGTDQLLRVDVGNGTASPVAYPLVGETLLAMAVDPLNGNLYGVSRTTADVTHLVQITFSAADSPATLTAIGSTVAGCCLIAPGAAVIDSDSGGRALFVQARQALTPAAMHLARFNLISGDVTDVATKAAALNFGLWQDTALDSDVIFANGFE